MPQPAIAPESIQRAIEAVLAQQAASPAPSVAPERPGGAMHYLGLPMLLGGAGLDAVTTAAALGRDGTYERNPAMGSGNGLMLALKLLANALAGYGLDKAHHQGAKWALPVAVGLGSAQIGAGIHNLRQGRE